MHLDEFDISNMWIFWHNAYHLYGDYQDTYEIPWPNAPMVAKLSHEEYLEKYINRICPSKATLEELGGGVYLPQPYSLINKKQEEVKEREGVLMIGDNSVKDYKSVALFYAENNIPVTILTSNDGNAENIIIHPLVIYKSVDYDNVFIETQKHKILFHNSTKETGCYALIEANGIIPSFVNEGYLWSVDFNVPTNRVQVDEVTLLKIYNDPNLHTLQEDTYKVEVLQKWDEFLTNLNNEQGE